jgi:cyclohexyl-isocyanide hydratase
MDLMSLSFGILCFPNVQQLDLTGPYEVFASAPDTRVSLVWKTCDPLRASTGLWLTPNVTFEEAPDFDVLCVPGGAGINALLTDMETLGFLRAKAARARYVTAVCTGSLVLGQAGLLAGRRATTHWNAHDFLPHFGAIPERARIVRDGNLITAGGVTSGIDFGLAVIAELMGLDAAEMIQLALEYAPEPPFASGTPEAARPEILAAVRTRIDAPRQERAAILGLSRQA